MDKKLERLISAYEENLSALNAADLKNLAELKAQLNQIKETEKRFLA